MHFTSYSTMTQIVLLNTLILVPKSLKNQLKSAPESTSVFLPLRSDFCYHFGIQNSVKIGRKSLQNLPAHLKSHKDGRQRCQDASRRLHEAPKKLPRCSKGLSRGSNLAPRSFQDNPFRPQSKIHNSPFAVCT